MRRRDLLLAIGGAAISPIAARAQRAPARIGFLFAGAEGSAMARAYLADLSEGFSAKGLTEGRDYVIEGRYAVGHYDRFPDLARELVQAGVRMILPTTIAGVRAAQALNPPIPVVMAAINDPVGTGLIASLAHPGGHTTGVATLNEDLTPKILEFLRAILPKASTLGVISNPANLSNTLMLDNFRSRAGGARHDRQLGHPCGRPTNSMRRWQRWHRQSLMRFI